MGVTRNWTKAKLGSWRLRRAARRSPLRVVIGSSNVFESGWTPTEYSFFDVCRAEHWNKYFPNGVDAILAEHVWEHISPKEALDAARNCFRHLKSGGYFRIAVPDGFNPDPAYIDWVKPGGSGPGSDDHRVLYDYRTLSELLSTAGFHVEPLEYFDENGKFMYRDWDPKDGKIWRSKRFDERNQDGQLRYTSLILDAKRLS